jgi:hypothetical protein
MYMDGVKSCEQEFVGTSKSGSSSSQRCIHSVGPGLGERLNHCLEGRSMPQVNTSMCWLVSGVFHQSHSTLRQRRAHEN